MSDTSTSDTEQDEVYTRCDICGRIVILSKALVPLPARPGGESKQVDANLCEGCKWGLADAFDGKYDTDTEQGGGTA